MTRVELLQLVTTSMFHNLRIELTDRAQNVHSGVVNQIAREDGSGYCFNVTLSNGETIFVRCKS